jgi:AraC family transcriptional regulator of arabinose operon
MTIQLVGCCHSAGSATLEPAGSEPIEWTLAVNLQVAPVDIRTVFLVTPSVQEEHHDRLMKDRSENSLIRFQPKPDWLPWLRWPRVAAGTMAVEVTNDEAWEALQACVQTLQGSAERPDPCTEAIAMNLLERMILLVHRGQNRVQMPIDRRIAGVVRLVKKESGKNITIEEAAAAVGLSPSRLSHLFREQMGVTFNSYVQLERLSKARLMLRQSNRTTEHIAKELGMDPTYFSSWFRRWSGLSPRSYRS